MARHFQSAQMAGRYRHKTGHQHDGQTGRLGAGRKHQPDLQRGEIGFWPHASPGHKRSYESILHCGRSKLFQRHPLVSNYGIPSENYGNVISGSGSRWGHACRLGVSETIMGFAMTLHLNSLLLAMPVGARSALAQFTEQVENSRLLSAVSARRVSGACVTGAFWFQPITCTTCTMRQPPTTSAYSRTSPRFGSLDAAGLSGHGERQANAL